MEEVDAVILGAGPAGATAALNLAPFRRVLLLDRCTGPSARIGESLPAAARRLLADMGLFEGFLSDGHLPCFTRRSVWGTDDPIEMDLLRDPDGHGWHLDRARFELRLRATAIARGAMLLAPAHVAALKKHGDRWAVAWVLAGKTETARARVVIEARGRMARPPTVFAARRIVTDRLVCTWLTGSETEGGPYGVTYTEAEPLGWWYTAPLPHGRRVLAFHTDADLLSAADVRNTTALLARARRQPQFAAALKHARFTDRSPFVCAAHGCRLEPTTGDGWFAAGDASMAFDPLSSQGLLNALYTGLAVSETVDRWLSGERSVIAAYSSELANIWNHYARNLAAWYAEEQRWPNSRFWQRHGGAIRSASSL